MKETRKSLAGAFIFQNVFQSSVKLVWWTGPQSMMFGLFSGRSGAS